MHLKEELQTGMPEPPLISIIMPAYNAEKYIGKAIQSIIDQTYKNWELIICDDASTDNTKQIIEIFAEEDSRIVTSHNADNQKLLKTRNRLLKFAKGDYITFQDADDYSCLNRLELLIKEFKKNIGIGLISSQVEFVNYEGKVLRVSNKPTSYNECLDEMYIQNVLGGSMMMISRKAFESVGFKFREYFDGLSNQDYDLAFLIAEKFEAYNLPNVLYSYRQIDQSTSKIISPKRIIAEEIVRYLALQRKSRGKDDLQLNNIDDLNHFFQTRMTKYVNDPSLVYRVYAGIFMYNTLFVKATKTAFTSVKLMPLKFINWRTFFYCLRITLLKSWLRL